MNNSDKQALKAAARRILTGGGVYLEPLGSRDSNPSPRPVAYRICTSCNATTPTGQRCEYCGRPEGSMATKSHEEVPAILPAINTTIYE